MNPETTIEFDVLGAQLATVKGDAFKAMCAELGFSIERGRQLMDAHDVMEALREQGCQTLPVSESQCRPLAKLDPEQMADVWQFCLAMSDGMPAGELIQDVSDRARRFPNQPLQFLTADDVANAVYPARNEFDIPDLLLDMQAQDVELPVMLYSKARSKVASTLVFYTDDDRLRPVLNDPTPIVNAGVAALVEVNFSIYADMPRSIALARLYNKRWLSRWWQSQGIRIFVDLNVHPRYANDNLIGVPVGWRAYATRGYTERLEDTISEYNLAQTHAGQPDILFMVYGGGKEVERAARLYGWIWFPEFMDERRK